MTEMESFVKENMIDIDLRSNYTNWINEINRLTSLKELKGVSKDEVLRMYLINSIYYY